MKTIKILILIFTTVLLSCNTNNDDKEPSGIDIEITPKCMAVIEADNAFGLKLFQEINSAAEPYENLFISPTSIGIALGMAYNGARTDTKEAFEECMQLSGLTSQEINEVYQNLMQGLIGADPDVTFTANSIWYDQDFQVYSDFLNTNTTYYNAEVSSLDFANPSSVDVINNWVASNTNDKITKIIDGIGPEQLMFLINAIYFKGTWKYEFDPANTNDIQFYPTSGSPVDVPMMSIEANLEAYSNGSFQTVKLPYGNGSYYMVVMLPTNPTILNELITSLSIENWSEWQSSFSTIEGYKLYLPKFKFEYEIELRQALAQLGLGVAFSAGADFSGISEWKPLFIDGVKHKTYVDVNEEGTEAAAVTSVSFGTTSVNPNMMLVNRPFLFSICEESTNAIVFIGKVEMPEY